MPTTQHDNDDLYFETNIYTVFRAHGHVYMKMQQAVGQK